MTTHKGLTAVITGVAGQDGSYLSELLLSKGYTVIGITRRKSTYLCIDNVLHLLPNDNFKIIYGDILDPTLISRVLHDYQPHEWYNLAAMSNVGQSFCEPQLTFRVNSEAVINQLELIRQFSPSTRFYQASTSEMWGGIGCPNSGYTEDSPFHPRSPYGVSKVAAYWSVINYREAYDIFACNGMLFNHSSPRRGHDFATRKITSGVASVKLGLKSEVRMGNLEAFRDEGHSKDFVKAMWMMLQQDSPDDYLISTGTGATIKEMFEYVCSLAELNFSDIYREDSRFMRPSEVLFLRGDPSKASDKLGWSSNYDWKKLLEEMYLSDIGSLKRIIK